MIHTGDCVEVMAGMEPDSVDAVACDPPYGLEFMGKEWDRLGDIGQTSHAGPSERDVSNPYGRISFYGSANQRCRNCRKWKWGHRTGDGGGGGKGCECDAPDFPPKEPVQSRMMQEWHHAWAAAALRVAKPGAYLLAFGGTRTVHRLTCALEDAGWIIRDMLVWAYASGFPKSRALLKPAWEPIVMARKPGPLRELAIEASRIGTTKDVPASLSTTRNRVYGDLQSGRTDDTPGWDPNTGRWPANVVLTETPDGGGIFDGGWDGVVGGGTASDGGTPTDVRGRGGIWHDGDGIPAGPQYGDTGTYSRFFLIPKAPPSERVLGDGRRSPHPTQKPEELIRHLVKLVTPPGGLVLDPFLGSGTLGVVCEDLGMRWVGIEREPQYAEWAQDRLDDNRQRGFGLSA